MSVNESLASDLMNVVARINRWATSVADLPIPSAQARLLALIEAQGPTRVSDLARADHSSQPTMTAQIQKLEDQGWAAREPDPGDARAVLISITERGVSLLRDIRRARALSIAPALDALDDAQVDRLRDCVATLETLLEIATASAPALHRGSR